MVRLATAKYDASNGGLGDPYAHLTNYSINKKTAKFVSSSHADGSAETKGFKRSLGTVLDALAAEGRDVTTLMHRVEEVVVRTVCSAEPAVAAASRSLFKHGDVCCAEMLGFDILIDDHLNPWLLEVNASPSIATDSPLDLDLKTRALTGFLNLMRIPAVPPERRHWDASGSGVAVPPTPAEVLVAVEHEAAIATATAYVRLVPDIDRADRYLPFLQDASGSNAVLHQTLLAMRESLPAGATAAAPSVLQPTNCAAYRRVVRQPGGGVPAAVHSKADKGAASTATSAPRVAVLGASKDGGGDGRPAGDFTAIESVLDTLQHRQAERSGGGMVVAAAAPGPADRLCGSESLDDIEVLLESLAARQAARLRPP
mmetsp:Transcript_27907/g.83382  ORF Transcript_27907/g.83382 Transcript_27907/m.83382 type:complete len:371 (-) Transcript_27907:46-1158(-)